MSNIVTTKNISNLPFKLETNLERNIVADPDWLAGVEWGQPRPGHPEGKVKYHIRDILNNIELYFGQSSDRHRLRLIALLHDTFKYKQASGTNSGENHNSHAILARRFAEKYIQDISVLTIIELHDEAYKAFSLLQTDHETAERRAKELVARLENNLDLFMNFYFCDSSTPGKPMNHHRWFQEIINPSCEVSDPKGFDGKFLRKSDVFVQNMPVIPYFGNP